MLVDLDLAGLGLPGHPFKDCDSRFRKEYEVVPDDIYAWKRTGFFSQLVSQIKDGKRVPIYTYAKHLENEAQDNIARHVAMLINTQIRVLDTERSSR